MSTPKISVIIPVYNCENTLERCLDSVCRQTYSGLEIICINDGSQDKSLSIMKTYEQFDPRVIIIDKINEGVSRARNIGLSVCTGDYVMFVDADDYIAKDMIQSLHTAIGTDHDVAISGYTEISSGGYAEIYDYKGCESRDDFILNCIQNTGGVVCSKLYRTSLIRENGILFDEKLSFSEDLIFALQNFIHAHNFATIQYAGYFYDRRNENLSNIDVLDRLKKSLHVHDMVGGLLEGCTIENKNNVLNRREESIVYVFLLALVARKEYEKFQKAYWEIGDRINQMKFTGIDKLNRLWLTLYRDHRIKSAYLVCRARSVLVKCAKRCHIKRGK